MRYRAPRAVRTFVIRGDAPRTGIVYEAADASKPPNRLPADRDLDRERPVDRDRPAAERAPVAHARVPPVGRVGLVGRELRPHLGEAAGVDVRAPAVPGLPHPGHVLDARLVAQDQLVPEEPPVVHAVVPRHVVEPHHQVLRDRLDVPVATLERREVLRREVAPGRGAVVAEPLAVGLVVVDGAPVVLDEELVRLGPVVVAGPELMPDAERRLVAHQRLPRAHHHLHDRADRALVVGPRHPDPVLGDVVGVELPVPCLAAEREQVRLREVVAGQVVGVAEVGHADDRRVLVVLRGSVDDLSHAARRRRCRS